MAYIDDIVHGQINEPLECMDEGGPTECRGPVEWHSIDPGRTGAFPRCQRHWEERLDRRENSMEKYENCVNPPAWFDPSYAGEAWGPEDY
jgi:hypothetical protein